MKKYKISNLLLFKNSTEYTDTHPPIYSSNLSSRWHPFQFNTDASYQRQLSANNLKQTKFLYLFVSICSFLIFIAACMLMKSYLFVTVEIFLQSASLLAYLFLFTNLITYLASQNTLKEYEYHACIIFYKTNAFLWLCSILSAIITMISMIVSFQCNDIYILLCNLCCSCLNLLLYCTERKISYSKLS